MAIKAPLSPELWEQALINGRRIHSGNDSKSVNWAEKWYVEQGGRFDTDSEPVAEPQSKSQADPSPSKEEKPVLNRPKKPAPASGK